MSILPGPQVGGLLGQIPIFWDAFAAQVWEIKATLYVISRICTYRVFGEEFGGEFCHGTGVRPRRNHLFIHGIALIPWIRNIHEWAESNMCNRSSIPFSIEFIALPNRLNRDPGIKFVMSLMIDMLTKKVSRSIAQPVLFGFWHWSFCWSNGLVCLSLHP